MDASPGGPALERRTRVAPPRAPAASPLRRNSSAPTPASRLRQPQRDKSPFEGSPAGATRRTASFTPSRSTPPRSRSTSPVPDAAMERARARVSAIRAPSARGRSRSVSPADRSSPDRGSPSAEEGGRAERSRSSSSSAAMTAAADGADLPPAGGFRQSNVRVAVRCRPLGEEERRRGERPAVDVRGRTVTLTRAAIGVSKEDDDSHVFGFDHAFGPSADQLSVFAACGAPLVKELLSGFNATVFAYGQTGSGKTHTMIGTDLEPGLVPRVSWFLFERLKALGAIAKGSGGEGEDGGEDGGDGEDGGEEGGEEGEGGGSGAQRGSGRTFSLKATYLQLYNESLIDMLEETGAELKIRSSPLDGIFVSGLSEHPVERPEDVAELISRGNRARATASTKMNAASSRSHAVFSLILEQRVPIDRNKGGDGDGGDGEGGGEGEGGEGDEGEGGGEEDFGTPRYRTLRSKINLVDLAGSERAKLSGADEDASLMKEMVNINKSLSALGNVIAALSDGRSSHVPYRESKLTHLLEESLGGNSHTVMINNVSTRGCHTTESLSTLQWAKRAQSIVNISVQGDTTHDEDSAMARMKEMGRMQKQAAAEAQQAARERQIEMQAELDAARSEAEGYALALERAEASTAKKLDRLKADYEARLSEANESSKASQSAAVQRKEAELRRQLGDEENTTKGALASARRERASLATQLLQAAERETKLQRQLAEAEHMTNEHATGREEAELAADDAVARVDAAEATAAEAAARCEAAESAAATAKAQLAAVKAEAEAAVSAEAARTAEMEQLLIEAKGQISDEIQARENAEDDLAEAREAEAEAREAAAAAEAEAAEAASEAAGEEVEAAREAEREAREAERLAREAELAAKEGERRAREELAAAEDSLSETTEVKNAAEAEAISALARIQQLEEELGDELQNGIDNSKIAAASLVQTEARAEAAEAATRAAEAMLAAKTAEALGAQGELDGLSAQLSGLEAQRATEASAAEGASAELAAVRAELTRVTAERDELRQLDSAQRARCDEMVGALAAADARIEVQREHRDELQRQVTEANALAAAEAARSALGSSQGPVVEELRHELEKAHAEARSRHADAVRLEASNTALQRDLEAAASARDAAADEAASARERKLALQAELGALKGEVSRSRESVSKAMADVQAQVEERRKAWLTERKELISRLVEYEAMYKAQQDIKARPPTAENVEPYYAADGGRARAERRKSQGSRSAARSQRKHAAAELAAGGSPAVAQQPFGAMQPAQPAADADRRVSGGSDDGNFFTRQLENLGNAARSLLPKEKERERERLEKERLSQPQSLGAGPLPSGMAAAHGAAVAQGMPITPHGTPILRDTVLREVGSGEQLRSGSLTKSGVVQVGAVAPAAAVAGAMGGGAFGRAWITSPRLAAGAAVGPAASIPPEEWVMSFQQQQAAMLQQQGMAAGHGGAMPGLRRFDSNSSDESD